MERTKCEIYSRIVGYLRPINDWNDGKIAEYKMRVNYNVPKDLEKPNVSILSK